MIVWHPNQAGQAPQKARFEQFKDICSFHVWSVCVRRIVDSWDLDDVNLVQSARNMLADIMSR